MTPNDRPAFAALLADVLGFYGQAMSPFAMSVWWEACKPFDMDAVRAAMTRHATDPDHGHFAPKPADVIRQLRGSTADAALMAWQDVLSQVRSLGSYGTPALTDAQREAVHGVGGWGAICRSDERELSFLQKRFIDHYTVQAERIERQSLPGTQSLRIA